ncbi:hypothetical protein [Neobacillus muris]|uniref:hypothetical protein n=1 Tax=Neobacillus muris TaxID=2941334 RepID=UPI00203D8054|nr:hypothetical protein [Neobacillus muris]
MDTQDFLKLSSLERVELVNKMLENEQEKHLENVAAKLGLKLSTFSKIMRDNASYQYNQTSKRYDRILTIEEYKRHLNSGINENRSEESLQFVTDHLDELKTLLNAHKKELILEPEIYDPNSKTITKTLQMNAAISERFSKLCSSQFPLYRTRDLFSKCMLDFINKYESKKTPDE